MVLDYLGVTSGSDLELQPSVAVFTRLQKAWLHIQRRYHVNLPTFIPMVQLPECNLKFGSESDITPSQKISGNANRYSRKQYISNEKLYEPLWHQQNWQFGCMSTADRCDQLIVMDDERENDTAHTRYCGWEHGCRKRRSWRVVLMAKHGWGFVSGWSLVIGSNDWQVTVKALNKG